MKRVKIISILAAVAVTASLTACDDKEPVSTPAPTTAPTEPSRAPLDNVIVEMYETSVSEFVERLTAEMEIIADLMESADSGASIVNPAAWVEKYSAVHGRVEQIRDEFVVLTTNVPEKYSYTHVQVNIGISGVYDALNRFIVTAEAMPEGGNEAAAAFYAGLEGFVADMTAAKNSWSRVKFDWELKLAE